MRTAGDSTSTVGGKGGRSLNGVLRSNIFEGTVRSEDFWGPLWTCVLLGTDRPQQACSAEDLAAPRPRVESGSRGRWRAYRLRCRGGAPTPSKPALRRLCSEPWAPRSVPVEPFGRRSEESVKNRSLVDVAHSTSRSHYLHYCAREFSVLERKCCTGQGARLRVIAPHPGVYCAHRELPRL